MKKYLTDMTFMISFAILVYSSFLLLKNLTPIKLSDASTNSAPAAKVANTQAQGSSLILQKVKTQTPGVWVVAQDGSGDVKSLKEALSQVSANEKILLKKGIHQWPNEYFDFGDMEITGEGEESVLEMSRSLYIKYYSLKLSNLKIINKHTVAALNVSNGNTLTLKNVHLTGNNENSGVSVRAANLVVDGLKLEKLYAGIYYENPLVADVQNVEVSRASYAIMFRSDDSFDIKRLRVKDIRVQAINKDEKYVGRLNCLDCNLETERTPSSPYIHIEEVP